MTSDQPVLASQITPTSAQPKITKLEPRETMAQRRRREELAKDCGSVAAIIGQRPGIGSKDAIAGALGLTHRRVSVCLRQINSNETPFMRVDYGCKKAKEGPYAGKVRWGWWPMRRAAYADVMDQADGHSASVERGVRRSRLDRLAFAQGLTTKQAQRVVEEIEERLDVQIEEMSETDFEAFMDLVRDEIE